MSPMFQTKTLTSPIRMRRTHQSLTKRRLVVDHGGTFSMHRSLQRGIRERLSQDKGQQQTVFEQAVALVREVFPRPNELQQPTPDKWSECQKLLPHLHALHDVYHASNHHIQGSLEFAQLLLDAGMDQFEQGIIVEGLLLLHTAENVLDASSSPALEEHQVMRANIHAMIAIMYDDVGITKREEAWKRRETALSIRQRTFENSKGQARKDEMLVYNSWMEYAISLLHYHRFTDAEPIINKCLAKFREWGSEDDIPFEYAKYYNKIALVRMYQGRFKIAIECAQKGMELMSSTGYNMFTSRFKFDMACIVLQSGDLDRALQIHVEIHQQRIETVGPSNPLSLHSMYAIGAIHELKEDYYEAA
jgi:tetratricopeptide (TPR) repeat protein